MLDKPTHALFVTDNWDGERSQYWTLAYIKDDVFYCAEKNEPVMQYQGDEIHQTVVLNDKERDTHNDALSSSFGDGWYEGFLHAKRLVSDDEDLDDYDALMMSEDKESMAKVGVRERKLLDQIAKLTAKNNELDKALIEEIENRDCWEARATKLACSVGEYFSEDVGEHSSCNCPINNAHELLNQI